MTEDEVFDLLQRVRKLEIEVDSLKQKVNSTYSGHEPIEVENVCSND